MVSNSNFLLKDIPKYHPLSIQYEKFWKEQKRKCIEGAWAHGKYMPPKLYFYINFYTILLNKDLFAKQKIWSHPRLRDIEWEIFYNVLEAKGFSGFSDDEEFTCVRKLNDAVTDVDIENVKLLYPTVVNSWGRLKKYIPAREYLRKIHKTNLGKPLYQNESQDFLWLTARGVGKSYITSAIMLHEWIFDGVTDYDEYLAHHEWVNRTGEEEKRERYKVSLLVGAADAKYTRETLSKAKQALERVPGSQTINKVFHPSPFTKQWKGSWDVGNEVIAEYKKKVGGDWKDLGSKSTIKNRSFKDNPFAGQGDRNTYILLEEVGMFQHLIASRNALEENMKHSGVYKFGTMLMIGTGGDMHGGGTWDAQKMFYDPEAFNLLSFNDTWEHRGKIAYFTPAYLGLNHLKDEEGNTNIEKGIEELMAQREKLMNSKSGRDALDNVIQYQPLVPSEVFLTKQGNIFPISELRDRLAKVDTYNITEKLEKKVKLYFDSTVRQGVNYKIDVRNELTAINNFPWSDDNNREGCVVIYDFPELDEEGNVPKDLYIIGHDPYRSDSASGGSLAATIVLKTKKHFSKYGHDEVVAVYYGRPYEGRHIVNENLLKLGMFYNAKIYFENNVGNVKEYFEKMKRLDLLAKRPQTVLTKTASFSKVESHEYGYPISNEKLKLEAISYVRDWLLEERGRISATIQYDSNESIKDKKKGKHTKQVIIQEGDFEDRIERNLDKISDRVLLKELIMFNMDGNFDAVMALAACIIGLEENHNKYKEEVKDFGELNKLNWFATNKKVFPYASNYY